MRAYASCDHLAPVTYPTMMSKKDMLSIRQRRGKVVEVYDGRKWPVVRCGSVYVAPEDTAQKVTQTVVTATSVAEKRRRAGKYTVAVGTSHGHVQAFLEDADSVLAALDNCQAEEKCLMLIKRPKDSAKKMLKSHSWANLSVSDPQLYRQFNGIQLSQFHNPGLTQKHKVRRLPDEHSVTSTDTDVSEQPRRRYISNSSSRNGKENGRPGLVQTASVGSGTGANGRPSQDPYLSDSNSSLASSDYQYVPRREREREREWEATSGRRGGDLRYSSIPEDAQEINNNNSSSNLSNGVGEKGHPNSHSHHPSAPVYHSCHDLSFASQTSNGSVVSRSDWSRQNQGQGRQDDQGHSQGHSVKMVQISGSQVCYRPEARRPGGEAPSAAVIHDPGDMEEGARSVSMGNLSTGLTFSLVGQRKADSMLDLSSTNAHSSQHPHGQHQQGRQQPVAPLRHRRSEGGGGDGAAYRDFRAGERAQGRSPRHNSYPQDSNAQYARSNTRDAAASTAFSPQPQPRESGGYRSSNGVQSPPFHHHQSQKYHNGYQDRNQPPSSHQYPNGSYMDSNGGGRPRGGSYPHHQPIINGGGGAGSSSSSNASREQTPQSEGSGKSKRSLPNVPLNETSERIKRFTEMMRSRMSAGSSAGNSTCNSVMSQTPTSPPTPVSRQTSVTDTGSDCEVSTLLDVRLTDAGYPSSPQKHSVTSTATSKADSQGLHLVRQEEQGKGGGEMAREERRKPNADLLRPCPNRPNFPASQETPPHLQFYGEGLGDSGQGQLPFTPLTPLTLHSHSSTMDSGYTTNTEGDCDSTTNTSQQLSPPHSHLQPHQPHPHQQQLNQHPMNHHHHHQPPPPPRQSHNYPPPQSQPTIQQQSHQQNHQQQQQQNHRGAGAEASRQAPVPVPRNLSLASARKYNSMQNVSSGGNLLHHQPPHSQNQHQPLAASHSSHHPGEWGVMSLPRNPQPGLQSVKGPGGPGGPVRAQHSLNSVEQGGHAEHHQRRSLDLAHNNFKPLDFVPVGAAGPSGGAKSGGGGGSGYPGAGLEEFVVKPRALSVSGSKRTEPGNGAGRRDSGDPGRQELPSHLKGEGYAALRLKDNLPLACSSPPSILQSPSKANGVNTLSGHWKCNNVNDVNTVNNNNNANHNKQHSVQQSSSSSSDDCSSNKTTPSHQRTVNSRTSLEEDPTTSPLSPPPPSLFQLSQSLDLCSVKLSLPPEVSAGQVMTLTSLPVTLPAPTSPAPLQSPQGRFAKLGGPGSAFRPVKTGGGPGGQITVDMTALEAVDQQHAQICVLGELRAGDILLEMEGQQCAGWTVASVQHVLENLRGDVTLSVARKKEDNVDNRMQTLESTVQKLEDEVQRLNQELSKKDARILELSTMLPWKQEEMSEGNKLILESEEGAFVIGDNEFVV